MNNTEIDPDGNLWTALARFKFIGGHLHQAWVDVARRVEWRKVPSE